MDTYRLLLQKVLNKINTYYELNKKRMMYDSSLATHDSHFLYMIMQIVMHENEEFYDEFGSTFAINYKEYEALCQKYGLVI